MRYRLLLFLLVLTSAMIWSCQPSASSEQTGTSANTPATEPAPNAPEDTIPETKALVKEKEMYENTNRMVWQKPEMILSMLGDLENKTVADIGAGTGFFAKRLTQKAAKVIAIDIDQRFLNYIDSVKVLEMDETAARRLETRLASPTHPNLAPEEADVIMIVNTFMYIQDKDSYLKTLRQCLSANGTLMIVDFKRKRTNIGPPSAIRLPLYELEEMMYENGYTNIKTNDTVLDYQYIITARK
ncbi:MAG: class I SAM-dependent methyltransferase [Phaeodactylibacter sp.]|uniref:class I SAM-dependent methyltransferase n=1 Tax=Phaeodactylibacter sp. TaxID=1940289 RepID=UPI0032ED2632